MTVALKRAKGDLIWIDAVLSFNRQRSASVTKHPIETGAYVSDHTTIENPTFSVNGVISDVDFNLQRPNISPSEESAEGWTKKQFENNVPIPSTNVEIAGGVSKYTRYLPESVSQFFTEQSPSVVVGSVTRPKTADALEADLIEILKGKEKVSLIEFSGNRIKKVWDSCVMTSLTFDETPDSGDALWPNMTFEQVVYALSVNVPIPQQVKKDVKNKASPTTGKGSQSPTKGAANLEDPKTTPTNNSRAVSGDISAAALTQKSNNQ
jgi:hypothetical protein